MNNFKHSNNNFKRIYGIKSVIDLISLIKKHGLINSLKNLKKNIYYISSAEEGRNDINTQIMEIRMDEKD